MSFQVEKSKLQVKALDRQVIRTDEALPKGSPFIWIISGRKGSGKSSVLLNALKTKQNKGGLAKFFSNIYMVSPTASHDTKFKKLVDELNEDGKYYDTLNESTMTDIVDKIKQYNEAEENQDVPIRNLLILDDCMASLPAGTQKSATLNNLFILSRHHKLSIIVTTQKYNGLSRLIRTQADLVSFFRTDNKKELDSLLDDVNVNDDLLRALYEFATEGGKNSFLHINMLSNPVTYCKNFDKILI